jgi:Phage tail lysozyme
MALPENAEAIYNFFIKAGFSENAAAGIVGNIAQESSGNPAAPGGGLIQISPGNPGYTTNTSLAAQLAAAMKYILANGSISDINAHASTPQDAALYFSNQYERPLASAANNSNREDTAAEVLTAAKSGNWDTSSAGSGSPGAATTAGLFSWPDDITGFFKDSKDMVDAGLWLFNPSSWLRITSFFVGSMVLVMALWVFTRAASGKPLVPQAVKTLGKDAAEAGAAAVFLA